MLLSYPPVSSHEEAFYSFVYAVSEDCMVVGGNETF
jgi:hypothetical protein